MANARSTWAMSSWDTLPAQIKDHVSLLVAKIGEREITQKNAYLELSREMREQGHGESKVPSYSSFNRYVRRELGLDLQPHITKRKRLLSQFSLDNFPIEVRQEIIGVSALLGRGHLTHTEAYKRIRYRMLENGMETPSIPSLNIFKQYWKSSLPITWPRDQDAVFTREARDTLILRIGMDAVSRLEFFVRSLMSETEKVEGSAPANAERLPRSV